MSQALLLLVFASFVSAARAEASGEVEGVDCPVPWVRVLGAIDADFHDICTGAKAALDFFARIGLYPTAPLFFVVGSPLPAKVGPTAVGCYVKEENRIYVVPFAEFEKQETWFKVPIIRDIYQSLAAHETAHALASCHFKRSNPTIQAQEHVAYAAMFSTMKRDLRDQALTMFPGTGFTDPDRITGIRYMVDPMRFAIDAYRHYVRPENGPKFLQQVLSGAALTD
ncbi:MAG: hypothetical protein OEZ08_14700 [Betaproteobacteria bacterium]|nr:hypothetical protein [Betaproteobacteria bacterium]